MLILNGILWGAAIGLGALSAAIPLGIAIIIVKTAIQAKTTKKEG